ncbi:MAG: response regulator, partial [Desulfobacteraceae bacterium]
SISKELAGILGGEIHAVSSEGKGSTFTLYLPETLTHELNNDDIAISGKKEDLFNTGITESSEKTGDSGEFIPDDRNDISENDKSVLIIEDDQKFAETLRDFSRERGFKAVVSQNGEIGLHYTEEYKPSTIIMDVNLPGLNGLTLLSRLKDNSKTRHIPVYFISGSDNSRETMRMGAVDYLEKPVKIKDLKKLFEKIEDVISKSEKNLLVIEDNPVTRKIIEKLFDGTEVRIVNVSTGREAMEKLETSVFDCVILDLSLPDISGFEILSQIKNNSSWLASPIVVYTGKRLSAHERAILDEYTESIVVKGANSPVKLLDEVSLFLHLAESKLPEEKRKLLRDIHDKESILKGKKILLTDDDMRNVFVLANILEQKGMKVFVTKNGREALDCLRDNHDIDLVIMDMMMPVMDGYTAIKEIREQKSFANLPIIALTAKAMKGDRAKCIEAGASDYLSKPFEKDRLFSLLRAWLY